MRSLGAIVMAAAALVATQASAQGVDLTGRYRCVQLCEAPGQAAFVTQNGWNLNLLNEVGEPSRAWIDWYGHLWAQRWNEGAIYSPDGMTIQFDRGTVWQRDLGELAPPPPAVTINPPPAKGKKRALALAPAAPAASPAVRPRPAGVPAALTAFDGSWSVLILTQNGGCDRAYRYGVRISNGYVLNESGESVSLRGRVAPNGAIQVNVSSPVGQADGEGRLLRTSGNGTWQGQGPTGICTGVWQAERRG
jgi:hypothetical protein